MSIPFLKRLLSSDFKNLWKLKGILFPNLNSIFPNLFSIWDFVLLTLGRNVSNFHRFLKSYLNNLLKRIEDYCREIQAFLPIVIVEWSWEKHCSTFYLDLISIRFGLLCRNQRITLRIDNSIRNVISNQLYFIQDTFNSILDTFYSILKIMNTIRCFQTYFETLKYCKLSFFYRGRSLTFTNSWNHTSTICRKELKTIVGRFKHFYQL